MIYQNISYPVVENAQIHDMDPSWDPRCGTLILLQLWMDSNKKSFGFQSIMLRGSYKCFSRIEPLRSGPILRCNSLGDREKSSKITWFCLDRVHWEWAARKENTEHTNRAVKVLIIDRSDYAYIKHFKYIMKMCLWMHNRYAYLAYVLYTASCIFICIIII